MKGRALAVVSSLFLGALFARGVPSCTSTSVPVIPPMGYDQQVCLSIDSPIPGCVAAPDPANVNIPVTLALNSTFELRPPGACATNALNNCGHVIVYVNGQCNNQSASLITDVVVNDVPVPYGPMTITALLVDDCNNPWTLAWDDAGVLDDGGVMCVPDAGADSGSSAFAPFCPTNAPPAPRSNVTNTCPANMAADAAVNIGPYFATVTINVQPSCGGAGGSGGAATSSAGTGGAATSSAGTGGAATSSVGTGGAATSSAGTGGAVTTSSAGTGGAATSSAGTGGAATSSAGTGGAATSSAGTGGAATSSAGTGGTGTGMGGAGPTDAGDGG